MLHANEVRPEALLAREKSEHPGGDAAVWRMAAPEDEALVFAIDTLVSGVHFRAEASSGDVAYKALAVNLSDLAAMGAVPMAVAVALSAESLSGSWIEGFCRGLAKTARTFGIEAAAAVVTRGPLTISVEATGRVPPRASESSNRAQRSSSPSATWPQARMAAGSPAVARRARSSKRRLESAHSHT